MANTVQEVSASYFRRYASLHPEIWNEIIGNGIVHAVWGRCSIERFETDKSYLYISGHKVHISDFLEKNFSELRVSSQLAETIMAYIKRRDELDEEEWAEQDRKKLSEAERQAKVQEEFVKAQSEAQAIEHEKKRLEAIRQEKIRAEAERRRLLEFERQAQFQVAKEMERRNEIQKRAKSIQAFCKERGIHRLFHFTKLENLSSILQYGLMGRISLSSLNSSAKPIFNDLYRFDGFPDAICLSISYPNYQLFHKLNHNNKKEWVILVLDAYILWEFDCAFFETNAASGSVKNTSLVHRQAYSSLVKMFDDQPSVKRCKLGIPNYYSTNPQAEVLVLEPIVPEYISAVHFYDRAVMIDWLESYKIVYSQKIVTNTEYFNARMDYSEWKSRNSRISLQTVNEDFIEFE